MSVTFRVLDCFHLIGLVWTNQHITGSSPNHKIRLIRWQSSYSQRNDDFVPFGSVFCGFSVEKGLLHKGSWDSKQVMAKDWFWYRFLELANEPLSAKIDDAVTSIDDKLQIVLRCGVLTAHRWSQVIFEATGSDLCQNNYMPGDGKLLNAAKSKSIAELATEMLSLNTDETGWHWLDFHVGQTFTLDASGSDETENCAKMLMSFKPWVLEGTGAP